MRQQNRDEELVAARQKIRDLELALKTAHAAAEAAKSSARTAWRVAFQPLATKPREEP